MPGEDLLHRIAVNLRLIRGQRGLSREELAESAEVDTQLIKRIETGRANPALVVLSRLASALMISATLMFSSDLAADPQRLVATESEPFEGDDVGEVLIALRKDRAMSRREVARQAAVRPITLARYENGDVDARLLTVEPVLNVFGIGAEELVRAVEQRQRDEDLAGGKWHSPRSGVEFRLVTSGVRSRLWEWRLAPGTTLAEDAPLAVLDEIVTAIRGEVTVEIEGRTERLRRGASLAIPVKASRRFANAGRSTARLLRYQVTS